MSRNGHLAVFRGPKGTRDDLVEVVRPQLRLVPEEPETLLYLFNISEDEPDTVWSYERYTDDTGFAAHGHAPGVLEGLQSMPGLTFESHQLDVLPGAKGVPPGPGLTRMGTSSEVRDARGMLVRYDFDPRSVGECVAQIPQMFPFVDRDVGAQLYVWHSDPARPSTVWLYAMFATDDALESHLAAPDARRAFDRLDGLSTSQTWRTRLVDGKWLRATP